MNNINYKIITKIDTKKEVTIQKTIPREKAVLVKICLNNVTMD